MAAVKKSHMALLEEYLIGERARPDGEWDMFCPLHSDRKRSAGINVKTGVWVCHAGCGGGPITRLIRQRDDWVPPSSAFSNGRNHAKSGKKDGTKPPPTNAMVKGWHSALLANKKKMAYLRQARGLTLKTIKQYQIGLDGRLFAIPVYDEEGNIADIRFYDPEPGARRKIWSYGKGYGGARLYPIEMLEHEAETIFICEGEWDTMLMIQHGYHAITRTGAADVWNSGWGVHFKGKTVYVCHDMDTKGQAANRKVGRALAQVAKELFVLTLPFDLTDKHGKDLTDFWIGHSKREFRQLLRLAEPLDGKPEEPDDLDPSDATVLDSFDSRKVGKPLRLTLTIKGKRDPGYSVPAEIGYSCTQDAGAKCTVCPLNAAGGDAKKNVERKDPRVQEMMDVTKQQLGTVMREHYGIPKCPKVRCEPLNYQAVEVLFGRPSVDHSDGSEAGAYKNVKITSVGRHNTMPNNTVRVTGALYPSPKQQLNEFQAWDVDRMETSLDNFELSEKNINLMKRFCPREGQRPLKKLSDIAKDMATHVTKIYGRPEMHAGMDLTFHSALSFNFGGQHVARGWLDFLIVGDTRTGKSEAAQQLTKHYGAGEIVSCESASFAGIVGGLQQYGSGKEWAISWGAIPINDRRLVVLDEVSGLQPDEIAQMSSVRSSGTAELTKIQSERTFARTRLIWLGNPRNKRMSEFTRGVDAIKPLIGNAEDIARFDLAMSVVADEVSSDEINRYHEGGSLRYSAAACRALIRWVWSRTSEQVHWARGAEQAVYTAAGAMGKRYIEDPPLVQVANVRIKIARVSVALAARLFSTNSRCEKIVVTKDHVEDAVAFIDRLYGMKGFGYGELSKERIADQAESVQKQDKVRSYLKTHTGLAKFLRNSGSFRRQDLEEIMNVQKEQANAIINTLWESRMIKRDKGDIVVQPTLHELLREV